MNVDANKIIDQLTMRIAGLIRENAILQAQVEQLLTEKQQNEQKSE